MSILFKQIYYFITKDVTLLDINKNTKQQNIYHVHRFSEIPHR